MVIYDLLKMIFVVGKLRGDFIERGKSVLKKLDDGLRGKVYFLNLIF
jgi:hypothetical protein